MIRRLWYLHRTVTLIGLGALIVAVGVVSVMIAVRPASTSARSDSNPPLRTGASKRSKPASPPNHRVGYVPRYITPPDTPAQGEFDAELAREENPTAIAAAEALAVPAGRYPPTFPPVDSADTDDAIAYADAFVNELLDVDYRTETRAGLLAWAQAEAAANTLPGVPTSVGFKSLYASLAAPDLPGTTGSSSPVPSPASWATDAEAGVIQHPRDLRAGVDQAWSELIGQGFIPKDPLMSLIDVSGSITVTRSLPTTGKSEAGGANRRRGVTHRTPPPSDHEVVEHFSLVLGVGSALGHPGYGASAVQSWTVNR